MSGKSAEFGKAASEKKQDAVIRLGQFIKLTGMVGTGGEGKMLILDGLVKVNGEVCLQRGRQLFLSDTVEADGEIFKVSDYI